MLHVKTKVALILALAVFTATLLVSQWGSADATETHWNKTMDPSKDGNYYSMSLFVLKPEEISNTVAVIKFKHAEGWKWNDKYPNKFISNSEYKVLAKHVDLPSEGETQVWLLFNSEAKNIQVQGKYSFCSKSQCVVFNRKISFFNITP